MNRLSAQHLTCAYSKHTVLHDLSLAVQAGEVLALLGPNGAGKTTLLRTLARLLRPRAGNVLLAGDDIWRLRPRTAAQRLALAPQSESMTTPVTIEQAVALGRAPHRGWLLPYTARDRQVIEQALEQTGLQALRHRFITELSGGEQRRVILARALAQEPHVLLLDEPTTHLDLRYQAELLALIQRLAQQDGIAIVVTLHDLNHAALCATSVALLARGTLVALGSPADVLTPERLSQVYGVTVVVTPHPVYGTPMVAPVFTTSRASQNTVSQDFVEGRE
ncbi:MAG: ABC transporter ATP-binding protein [Candidatus Tectomicrobia bacterium]|uniref:ABC transporter ATP-binding protein n=1 Tax=Tectimicrobiota bacterium TaxID=2528274 RepID=A0A937VZP8_UNCTE|nr:ABC transporter ATP-binding protein [Candidatus Tectomicrobia bacterium]